MHSVTSMRCAASKKPTRRRSFDSKPARTSCSTASRRMAEPLSVVVAEDEAINRLDLVETLTEEGYAVVGDAGDGDEALALIEQLRPDVAVLDIKMPGRTGLEVAHEVAALGSTAVVILTAFSQRELIEDASAAGALAYLVKPFQRSELVPAIEIARARHRELQALTAQTDLLAEQLEVRKLVDRAKGILIDRHGMSEADAFRHIQTEAMNARTTMGDVAQWVIDGKSP